MPAKNNVIPAPARPLLLREQKLAGKAEIQSTPTCHPRMLLSGSQYKTFSSDLTRWYHKHKRDLPWRRTRDPYKIWVSEVMLQQTTVNAVTGYYEKWFKAFPTVHDLARAPLQAVLKQWQGLGYYNRARNLHKTAAILLDKHQGRLPQDHQTIRSLPGFGPYTSGSVLSIAYDVPLTIIDANVRRVVMRLLALPGAADAKQHSGINEFLLKVLPPQGAGDFNQALMELGALVCRHKGPLCNLCPLKKYCRAKAQGKQDIIPEPKKKILKDIDVAIALIKKGDRFYMQKRPAGRLFADLWEFPGGKVEQGETKPQALGREIMEELGAVVKFSRHLFDLKHFYTHFRASLSVFDCVLKNQPKCDSTHRWISPKDFSKYPMPSGTVKILEKLKIA